jgi:excisionase family DNA binding protein
MTGALTHQTSTEYDKDIARASSLALARAIDQHPRVSLRTIEGDVEEITLPAGVARILQEVLEQVSQGQAVVVLPVKADLTTSQAAEIIGISRPFLVRLLEQGDIPFYRVGAHRRVRLQDVLAYTEELHRRRAILSELVREAQELDMGY